jgi:hypothetical protein
MRACAIWLLFVAARYPAAEAQDGTETALEPTDADSNDAAAAAADQPPSCECVDSATWASPDNGGLCSTYRVGGVNQGYCAEDNAHTACPSSCDSCPACSDEEAAAGNAVMLWLGLPCIIFGLCAPFLRAVLFHLKDDRKTVVQAEAEAKEMQAIAPAPADPTPPMMLGMQDGAAMAPPGQPGQPGQQLPPADQSSIADDLRAPQSAPLPVGMGA